MGILGTQTCAVCGTAVRPPHARYRIANQGIICKNCYKKAQIQADQMKMGRIMLSADQIKKQIRDIEKFKKLADRKSTGLKGELAKFGIEEQTLAVLSEEKLAAVSLLLKKHETILDAVNVNNGQEAAVLMLTFAKLIELTPGDVYSFPLADVSNITLANSNQLTFEFDQHSVTFAVVDSEQVRHFITETSRRIDQ